jgi:hypothetical protein
LRLRVLGRGSARGFREEFTFGDYSFGYWRKELVRVRGFAAGEIRGPKRRDKGVFGGTEGGGVVDGAGLDEGWKGRNMKFRLN